MTKREENKYKKAFLYAIKSDQSDKEFIGSSYSDTRKIIYRFRNNYKKFQAGEGKWNNVYEIIKFDDNYIEKIKNMKNIINKEDLNLETRKYIKTINNSVNNSFNIK
jgi:hypothetical protein